MLGWLSSSFANTKLSIPLGRTVAKKIEDSFGIATVGEMLTRFPKKYAVHGHTLDVQPEDIGERITAIVQVEAVSSSDDRYSQSGARRPIKIRVTDGRRSMPAAIFGNNWLSNVLQPGQHIMILAKLTEFNQQLQLSNVDLMVIKEDGAPGASTGKFATLTKTADGLAEMRRMLSKPFFPVYRGRKGTSGLEFALYVQRVLEWLPQQEDPLDESPEGLVSFDQALRGMHFPQTIGPEPYRNRLAYDEALELLIAVGLRSGQTRELQSPICAGTAGGHQAQLRDGLPFSLTAGQEQVVRTIAKDLAQPTPMTRLLAGEVGSGKTVVALLAMLQTIDSGKQCAMLAPTEVLATQHFRSISDMLHSAGVDAKVCLLTGSLPISERRSTLLNVVSGDAEIVVGTHALISEGVEFFDLGLVVVDEQHRFGVHQRDALRKRGRDGLTPHLLLMTATPIPRTVAMTVFGDVEVSQLRELPGGRKQIHSFVVPSIEKPHWEARTWQRIAEEVAQGNRAFIVCPRINREQDTAADESLESNYARALAALPDARVGVLHGQLSPEEKDATMSAFARGDIDVLVSTTVIEVGVDVPEATVMMIRRAESFGVSQLHQLRGRVGRGTRGGLCFLCTHTFADTPERERLDRIAATTDGFELAELDLETRNFGDVLGTDQSGIATGIGLVDLLSDANLIEAASEQATQLIAASPGAAEKLTLDITKTQADFLDRS